MSIGIGAFCKRIAEDNNTVIYEYGSYDLNDINYRNERRIADGIITISKSALIEPDIHNKIKRLPNGKKKRIIKRIPRDVPLSYLFDNKFVTVENCSHCWNTSENGIDVMASAIVWHLVLEYQKTGQLPVNLSINK